MVEKQKSGEVSLNHSESTPALEAALNGLLQAIRKKGEKPTADTFVDKIKNPAVQNLLGPSVVSLAKFIEDSESDSNYPDGGIKNALAEMVSDFNNLNENSESPTDLITDFYDSPQFEALYQQAQKLKGPGERVTSADIGALLAKGSDKEKELYAHLVSDEYKDLSKTLWEKSEVRRKFKESFERQEVNDIAEFFKDLSDIPPEDQNDAQKLIIAFGKKFPSYKDKQNETWYLNQFNEQINKLKAPELKTLQSFYNSEDFKTIYNQVSANLGQAPLWSDIQKALKAGGHENIVGLSIKHKPESQAMWDAVWKQAKEAFEAFEKTEFDKFTNTLTAKDFADIDKTAQAFQNTRKRFAGAKRLSWYKQQLEFKQRLKAAEWKTQLNDFYKSDLPGIYAEVAQNQNKPPEWKDIQAVLKAKGQEDLLYILEDLYKTESEAAWTKFWKAEEIKFNETETKALQTFSKSLSVADWQNLDAAVTKFQTANPQYAGQDKADWYKKELEKEQPTKQAEWKQTMTTFYQNQLPALYDQVANEKNAAPEWQDIRAKLMARGDTDTLFILENVFKTESEAQWKQYWQQQKETFNSAEAKTAREFFKTLSPAELDNPSSLKARFSSETEFSANNEWFETQLTNYLETKKTEYETRHHAVVNALPDVSLASAMQAGFKNAKSFAEREQWLQENENKVREYTGFINQNQETENRLSAEVERHPDLKKKLTKLKADYAAGKNNYATGFYSPRKYADALNDLNTQLNEREALVDRTLDTVKQKTLNQVPQLPKKATSLDEFRDALKKNKFYDLDDKARKDERVRDAIRTKNKELYSQWMSAREQYLNVETRTQVQQAKQLINRVQLPKKLPAGLNTYEDFTAALKGQKIYAGLKPNMMKNETVRQAARDHNQILFVKYQAQQEAISAKENKKESPENEEKLSLKKAEAAIKKVQLSPTLQAKITEKIPANKAEDPNQFTIALRDLNVYQDVDPALLKNESLRQFARGHNQVLQQQYLANLNKAPLKSVDTLNDSENAENNFGLPSHYKINWDTLENNTNATQKATAIERFKQMHNRSDVGLQTVMQQFHQPLGTFILETLAVMPKDRYDKALNALKDVRVEAGKRADASQWLKVLCESAGLSYLEKEASAAWSQLKQNFSTHFGTSLDKAWEDETVLEEAEPPEAENDLADMKADQTPDVENMIDEDESRATSPQNDDDTTEAEAEPSDLEPNETESVSPETETNFDEDFEVTTNDLDAETDDDESLEADTDLEPTATEHEDAPETVEDADVNAEAMDEEERFTPDQGTLEVTDAALDDAALEDADDDPSLEADTETDDEASLETKTDTDLDQTETEDEDAPETVEDADDDSALEADTETDDEPSLENEDDDDLDQTETENEDAPETVEDADDDSALEADTETDDEASLETEADTDLDQTETENEDAPETLEDVDDDSALEADTEADDETSLENEDDDDLDQTETENEDAPETLEDVDDDSALEADTEAPSNDAENLEDDAPETTDESFEADTENAADAPPAWLDDNLKADAVEAVEPPENTAETAVQPEIIPVVALETKENDESVHEALVAWKNFTETNLPLPVSQESADLKKQFSEIIKSGLDEATIAKLKASGTWESLMASPLHQQLLRTHLKQHQALSNEGLHFFTALQQELFFSRSVTVNKFLEQLKSYILFTREITAHIDPLASDQDLSKDQAQALFNAFASKFHRVNNLKNLSLGFKNKTLTVEVKSAEGLKNWHFKSPDSDEA